MYFCCVALQLTKALCRDPSSNPCGHTKTYEKTTLFASFFRCFVVARQGFEPQLTVPKTAVLPLDDRALYSP
jgi:hypothetical protein